MKVLSSVITVVLLVAPQRAFGAEDDAHQLRGSPALAVSTITSSLLQSYGVMSLYANLIHFRLVRLDLSSQNRHLQK